jgi:hypothetical protein
MASSLVASGQLVTVLADWLIRPVSIHAVTATKVHPVKTRLFPDFVQTALRDFGVAPVPG